MIRAIATVQLKVDGLARLRPDQFDRPARWGTPGTGRGGLGQHHYPPARDRRRGLAEIAGICPTP